jgi:hypothetical protein
MSNLMKSVFCSTSFEGYHRWKDAPETFSYLRSWHRHMFGVKVYKKVTESRQIEFIHMKHVLDFFLLDFTSFKNKFELSCEELAEKILKYMDADCVIVDEDGENGAYVYKLDVDDEPELPNLKDVVKEYIEGLKNYSAAKPEFTKPIRQPNNEKVIKEVKWPFKTEPYVQASSNGVRECCFVGIEAEGPNRGEKTLFIPASCNYYTIQKVWELVKSKWPEQVEVPYIYIGAGNNPVTYGSNDDIIQYFRNQGVPYSTMVIEIKDSKRINDFTLRSIAAAKVGGAILVSHTQEDLYTGYATYHKYILGKMVVWNAKGESWATFLDDPLFLQDARVVLS